MFGCGSVYGVYNVCVCVINYEYIIVVGDFVTNNVMY